MQTASGQTRHQGATVFVYVDCGTNAPLPCGDGTKQDEAYCKPGVALPREAAMSALAAMPTFTAVANGTAVVTQTFPDPSPTEASMSILPASYAVTSDAVPTVAPTDAPTSKNTPKTTVVKTSTAAAASPTSKGTCQAGTLDAADCDTYCAGGTCTTGSTALGQQVTTCSDCP